MDEEALIQKVMDELSLETLDHYMDIFPQKQSFSELVLKVLEGKSNLDIPGMFWKSFTDSLFLEWNTVGSILIQVMLVALLFSILEKWTTLGGYGGQVTFFLSYGGVVLLLVEILARGKTMVQGGINWCVGYMGCMIPVLGGATLLSGKPLRATVYQELTYSMVLFVEQVMEHLFLPAVDLYVLLVVGNELLEGRFSWILEFLFKGVSQGVKLLCGAVLSLQTLEQVMAGARDVAAGNTVVKALEAIPGLGNLVKTSGEMLVGCTILIRNSIGMAGSILLVVFLLTPLIQILALEVLMKGLVVVLEPVALKSITTAVAGLAKGMELYRRLLGWTGILFLAGIAMSCVFGIS